MFQFEKTVVNESQSYKYLVYKNDQQLRYVDFLEFLQNDQDFKLFFIEVLSDIPFQAYQWETPPVIASNIDQLFEFVVTRSPGIDLSPDPGPFRQYFNDSDDVAVFNNLGNDARLIVPSPASENCNYSHIGTFTRQAPVEQQKKLWETVGRVTQEQISDQPIWLNTAGGGVAWLHVRLDSRPKYYYHRPYATAINF